jgi:NAD(P)-dependent dehydrogenase (short-subunit alcohol dehydrogenase family)
MIQSLHSPQRQNHTAIPVARAFFNSLLATGALSREGLTRQSAMGRLVEPHEVASAIAWLIGPESGGITGVNLPVDAGFLAGATWEAYGGFRDAGDER